MNAPALDSRPTGPHQPGTGWPDPVPHPGDGSWPCPRYPALIETQRVVRRVAARGAGPQ